MSKFEVKSNEIYDCIVVGLGGHGSSSLAHLAKEGLKVLGLEQFDRIHEKGSSHGRSRIYRQAYYEDPKYVPLLQRSLELWRELHGFYGNEISDYFDGISPYGTNVWTQCGGIMIGDPHAEVVAGTLASVREHNMPNEILTAAQVRERWPMFHLTDNEIGVYESNAGFLNPEACIEAYLLMAAKYGADIKHNEPMLSYSVQDTYNINSGDSNSSGISNGSNNSGNSSNSNSCGGDCEHSPTDEMTAARAVTTTTSNGDDSIITVTTSNGTYKTRKLVLTVGAWAQGVYGKVLPFDLIIERRVLFWFEPQHVENEDYKTLPVYIWDLDPSGNFYGFPEQSEYPGQVKVAFHLTGDKRQPPIPSPESLEDMPLNEKDLYDIRKLLEQKMPSLNGKLLSTSTCMYTTTPDEHFLVDFHPKHKNIVLASPCSGHGFKFCSIIGEMMSHLVIDGQTPHDTTLFTIAARMKSKL